MYISWFLVIHYVHDVHIEDTCVFRWPFSCSFLTFACDTRPNITSLFCIIYWHMVHTNVIYTSLWLGLLSLLFFVTMGVGFILWYFLQPELQDTIQILIAFFIFLLGIKCKMSSIMCMQDYNEDRFQWDISSLCTCHSQKMACGTA